MQKTFSKPPGEGSSKTSKIHRWSNVHKYTPNSLSYCKEITLSKKFIELWMIILVFTNFFQILQTFFEEKKNVETWQSGIYDSYGCWRISDKAFFFIFYIIQWVKWRTGTKRNTTFLTSTPPKEHFLFFWSSKGFNIPTILFGSEQQHVMPGQSTPSHSTHPVCHRNGTAWL